MKDALAAETLAVAVPFVDLRPSHEGLRDALIAEIAGLLDTGRFVNGPQVEEFESAFAEFCGTTHCVGMASGLDALRLGLLAAGCEPGDEVLVPALTFAATFEAVTQAGCRPVVVDVDLADYGLSIAAAESAVTGRTRFVLPVHLYGQMVDPAALRRFASAAGILVVEDACQAHGAVRDGVRAGTVGALAAFSFYPTKNLGAIGDAGALVTGDGEIAAAARALREHGQSSKYTHEREGWTARLDTLQAIVLLLKLPRLEGWNRERARLARSYSEGLDGVGDLVLPGVPPGSEPVWHLYVVRTADPEALASFLAERRIGAGRHYPEPPHLSRAYAHVGHERGAFPAAERVADEALSLPLFPGMTEAQLAAVVRAVGDYFAAGGSRR